MTPELRFTKIENLLQTLTESQVQQQVEIAKLQESQKELQESQKRFQESQIEAQNRTDQQIQTLVTVVGRLSDYQERADERLLSLIETVDRLTVNVDKLADHLDK